MDPASDEQCRLSPSSLQSTSLGDVALSSPNRVFHPSQGLSQSFSRTLGKRPSTATYAQSSGVLLPAARPISTLESEESTSSQDAPHAQLDRWTGFAGPSNVTYRPMSEEIAGDYVRFWSKLCVAS